MSFCGINPMSVLLWQGMSAWPVSALVVVLAALGVWWLYPSQVRLLPRAWRWILPGLRTAAIVALALMVLKPVLIRPKSVSEAGAVVILVDRSASMDVQDNARPLVERVRVASGLGFIPVDTRQTSLAPLLADLQSLQRLTADLIRANVDTDYARLAGQPTELPQGRLDGLSEAFVSTASTLAGKASSLEVGNAKPMIEKIASMNVPSTKLEDWAKQVRDTSNAARAALLQVQASNDQKLYAGDPDVKQAADDIALMLRSELVDRAINGFDRALVRQLPSDVPVYAFEIGDAVRPYASPSAEPVTQPSTRPASDRSDLVGGLQGAIEQLKGVPLLAVVLMSDGRQVGTDVGQGATDLRQSAVNIRQGAVDDRPGEIDAAQSLGSIGVPVFTVGVASASAPKDISVIRVSAATSAFVGETLTVRADVRGVNVRGQSVDVTFDLNGQQQTKKITFNDQPNVQVEFPVKLDTAGPANISLSVAPVQGEAATDNNRVSRVVKVMEDRVRVAMVTSFATWDFQYLHNALSRSSWAKVDDHVLNRPTQTLSMTPEQILSQQVVVLNDVADDALGATQWEAVYKLVNERGGSVIIVAGQVNVPGKAGARSPFVSDLLPYLPGKAPAWRVWPGQEAQFRLTTSTEARQVEALRLVDGPEGWRAWEQLPGFFRVLSMSDLKPNARPLLVERDSGQAVLTESRLGKGRVFFFGAEETWRWRAKVGERDQDRFWTQLIRYAGEEPYAQVGATRSLDADRLFIQPGEPLRVRARVLDDNGVPTPAETQTLLVEKEGQPIATLVMPESTGGAGGRFNVTVTDLPEGTYQLRLDTRPETTRPTTGPTTRADGPVLQVVVGRNSDAERSDLSGDDEFLKQLATSTGGEFFSIDQIDLLPSRLDAARKKQPQFVETSLWDSPYLFVFVLGCLGAEWGLRKRLGLI